MSITPVKKRSKLDMIIALLRSEIGTLIENKHSGPFKIEGYMRDGGVSDLDFGHQKKIFPKKQEKKEDD